MEDILNLTVNSSSAAAGDDPVGGLVAFGVLLTILLSVVMAFILVVLIPLAKTKNLPIAVRLLLSSQLLGSLVAAAAGFVIGLTGLVLALSGREGGNIPLCTFLTFVYSVGAVVRMWSMTAYSILLLLSTVFFSSKVKAMHILATVVAIWVFSCCLNSYILVPPPVYALHYAEGTACFPNYNGVAPGIRYGLSAMWIIVGGLIPVCISVVIPIICYCFLKSPTNRSRGLQISDYQKVTIRFTFFLIIGNVINLVGTVVTAIAALYVEGNEFYIAYSLVVVSLVPTPILILIFLAPVRLELGMCLRSLCSVTHKRVGCLGKSVSRISYSEQDIEMLSPVPSL